MRNWVGGKKKTQESNLPEPPGKAGRPPLLRPIVIRVIARRVWSWTVGVGGRVLSPTLLWLVSRCVGSG